MQSKKSLSDDVLSKENIVIFLRSHKDILTHEFGVTQIALFGSYARGEATSQSDIDLIIETKTPSFINFCKLQEFLEENLKKKVDLCYFKSMRSFIRQSIEKELIYA